MRTTTQPLTPGVPAPPSNGGGAPGAQLRAVVQKAVNMRRALMRARAGHRTGPSLMLSLARLEQWLARNPYPSVATVRAFPLYTDLAYVMPGTTGGAALLERARLLMMH